jgi:phage FluMu gp28-like protein
VTVYDLDKLATPEPWTNWGDGVIVKGDGPLSVATFSNETDAVLSTHCRNNYMKALEALKADRQLIACLEFPKSFHLSKAEVLAILDKAIEELVEIKDEI